jgi:hypothetical protein
MGDRFLTFRRFSFKSAKCKVQRAWRKAHSAKSIEHNAKCKNQNAKLQCKMENYIVETAKIQIF